MFKFAPLFSIFLASGALTQSYSATYQPTNLPKTTEQGQTGTNQCGAGSDQNSTCQNLYVNSIDDFCLFAPPQPGPDSAIGNTEQIEVAWCIKDGYGTRLIPDGAIKGAHFVQTPDYVQVTGIGDLTLLNIPAGNDGGELDPHGASGNGNPIGGLVFTNAFVGKLQQAHEWTNFMSATVFCIRVCKEGPGAPQMCNHIYDVMGCDWNMPGDYDAGSFDSCQGDSGDPMGIYGTSTFKQGQLSTPPAHPAPSMSSCSTVTTIGNGVTITSTSVPTSPTSTSSSGATTSTSTNSSQAASSTSGKPTVPAAPTTTSTSSSSDGNGSSPTGGTSGNNGASGGALRGWTRNVEVAAACAGVVLAAALVA